MTKGKKLTKQEQEVQDLTNDLQRTRADFENYRKRMELEKVAARAAGVDSAVMQLLPLIDTIERAISHMPEGLQNNSWAMGIASLIKNLDKHLDQLQLKRIEIEPGKTIFDPELHNAISADESEGETEVVAEELQAGYTKDGSPLRHAMVRVTRK